MEPIRSSFPYELRLGVTGHRNLPDAEGIARAVEQLLVQIDGTLSQQEQTPLDWTIVSPLAKGADRIVAAAVLERADSRLETILPLPGDEYRKDFDEPDDLQEFEQLLNRSHDVSCVAPGYTAHVEGETDDARQQRRNQAYMRVGRAVVDASEILIAVWNGQPAAGHGGTGDVVEYAVKRGRVVLWIDSENPQSAPRLIVAGQPTERTVRDEPPPLKFLSFPETAKRLSLGFHQLAAYNRDDSLSPELYKESLDGDARVLRRHAQQARLSEDALTPIVDHILPHYVRADQLAIRYQRNYVRATAGLFYLSAIAVTVVVGQILFLPHALWFIIFEILAMAAAVGLWLYCRREAWHEKWLHDRYLAERLRTALYTVLLDERPTVDQAAAERALPFYNGPENWLGATVGRIVEQAKGSAGNHNGFQSVKQFLIDAWLADQQGFHCKNERRKSHAAHFNHRLGLYLFVTTLLMAVLHLFGVGHHNAADGLLFARLDRWITFLAITLPVWGATLHAIANQLELERIAARSGRMSQLLGFIIDQAKEANSPETLHAVIEEGVQVIGVENHEWLILLSFRRPVLPT